MSVDDINIEDISFYHTMIENLNKVFTEYKENIVIGYNGGMFYSDINFLGQIKTLIDSGKNEYIILDLNNTPIEINDLNDFFNKCLSLNEKSLEIYYEKVKNIKQAKTKDEILDNYYEQ